MREKILFSDFDLKIINCIIEEQTIGELCKNLKVDYPQIRKHVLRLINLDIISYRKLGNFRIIKLNEKGISFINNLKILKWK